MAYLSFESVVAACPAAATVKRARRTTGDDYVGVSTGDLYRAMLRQEFRCVSAFQGPSFKRSYVPFARHALTFAPSAGAAMPQHFRITVLNAHNGLSPLMFAPGWYVPAFDATLYAGAVVAFHREFSEGGSFRDTWKAALAKAAGTGPAVAGVWRRMQDVTVSQPSRMAGRILAHVGSTTDIPAAQVAAVLGDRPATAGNVAAAALSGLLHSRFTAKTPGGRTRKVYAPRAIVRIERASFGAWYEAAMAVCRADPDYELPASLPLFTATPVGRGDHGKRRPSGSVIVTDRAVLADAALAA